jgi:hypothetical protein
MFSLSYTKRNLNLKYVLYKTNKLMMIYSYVITSLPKEAQVYNNTTMSFFYSSSLFYWLVGTRGTRCSLLSISCSSLGDSCIGRAEGDGPLMPGWSRPQVLSVGSQLMAFPADLSMAYPVQVLSHLHIG